MSRDIDPAAPRYVHYLRGPSGRGPEGLMSTLVFDPESGRCIIDGEELEGALFIASVLAVSAAFASYRGNGRAGEGMVARGLSDLRAASMVASAEARKSALAEVPKAVKTMGGSEREVRKAEETLLRFWESPLAVRFRENGWMHVVI